MNTVMQRDWDEISKKVIDVCVPKYNFNSDVRNKPIWMNSTALKITKRKYSSWQRYLNTKQGVTHQEYLIERNKSTHENRRARKDFEKKLSKECRSNPKTVWRYMKSTNKVSSGIPNLKKPDGTLTTSDDEIAETLNQQYYNSFTNEDTSNIPNIRENLSIASISYAKWNACQ